MKKNKKKLMPDVQIARIRYARLINECCYVYVTWLTGSFSPQTNAIFNIIGDHENIKIKGRADNDKIIFHDDALFNVCDSDGLIEYYSL